MADRVFGFGPAGQDKALGPLPVVARFCTRLRIREIIDGLCPARDLARITHGQVIEAVVANRLTSPTPMVRVQDWAEAWAVPEVFGIAADALNDDRIARAFDAIAPKLAQIVGSVGAQAISEFGIDVAQMHWDMTSISVYGTYPDPEPGFVAPRFGHPKDRRPDLKQVQTGLAVAADGGIPLFWRTFDGGAAEISQVVGAMNALRQLAGRRRFLLIGDSKLVSYTNLTAMLDAGVEFIAPLAKTYVPAAILAGLDPTTATPVDYIAERDQHQPPEQRGRWAVTQDQIIINPPKSQHRQPPLTLRRVYVYSTARASAAATARTKKLDRARGDLERLHNGLGSRYYPDTAAVTARINDIATKRRVRDYLHTEIGTDPNGKPTLTWSYNQTIIETEARTDGWYALVTNLPPDITPDQVLRRYKAQESVERRYHHFKGPLAVAPMFLHTNRRIDALINIICIPY